MSLWPSCEHGGAPIDPSVEHIAFALAANCHAYFRLIHSCSQWHEALPGQPKREDTSRADGEIDGTHKSASVPRDFSDRFDPGDPDKLCNGQGDRPLILLR